MPWGNAAMDPRKLLTPLGYLAPTVVTAIGRELSRTPSEQCTERLQLAKRDALSGPRTPWRLLPLIAHPGIRSQFALRQSSPSNSKPNAEARKDGRINENQ